MRPRALHNVECVLYLFRRAVAVFERMPSLPKHFWPVEWSFGYFRKNLSGFIVVSLASNELPSVEETKTKRDRVLQRTRILKPRDIRCFVVFRSVSPYFGRLVALLELLMLV